MTLAAAKPVTRSALFAPGGLIVAGLLWLGSLYFVGRAATAYQTFGCATTAVETVGKTDTIVDVFFAREAFLLAHLWIVVAAWGLVGARTGPSRGWTIVLLIGFVVTLVIGHWICWRCSTVGVWFGVPPWW
jgi:hypothetical protein